MKKRSDIGTCPSVLSIHPSRVNKPGAIPVLSTIGSGVFLSLFTPPGSAVNHLPRVQDTVPLGREGGGENILAIFGYAVENLGCTYDISHCQTNLFDDFFPEK